MTFLSQVDDYECCFLSIVLLFEIVIYVRVVEMRVKPPMYDAKKGTSGQEVGLLSSRFLLACD